MGNEINLWELFRWEFPVTQRLIYLNHAAVAPLSRRAAEAHKWLADDCLNWGSFHYDKWLAVYDSVRNSTAKLINAQPGEIAITKNTSEGIATVAMGMDWKRGDKVVAFREEFPANFYPWKRLEDIGVEVRWLSYLDPLEKIDEAAKGARLLAISFVQYLSGYRAPLGAIGEICHRHGCLFLVDAIQGLGAFPIDVVAARIHFLASDGHKWLLGPEGCGVMYVQQDVQDSVFPVEFGWTNVAGYNDYSSRDMGLRTDAGRYECGTLNTIGCFGLNAAMSLLLEAGVANIAAAVTALADRLAEGLSEKGYELLGQRTPETAAGIVSFRKAGVESQYLVRQLKDKGIVAAPRQGWVRMSPHFYISPAEIEHVLEAL